jgi:hypothetical protein
MVTPPFAKRWQMVSVLTPYSWVASAAMSLTWRVGRLLDSVGIEQGYRLEPPRRRVQWAFSEKPLGFLSRSR